MSGLGAFRNFPDTLPHPSATKKIFFSWAVRNMFDEMGTPNVKLRQTLSERHGMPVVAPTKKLADRQRSTVDIPTAQVARSSPPQRAARKASWFS